jgi:hypothetical protein
MKIVVQPSLDGCMVNAGWKQLCWCSASKRARVSSETPFAEGSEVRREAGREHGVAPGHGQRQSPTGDASMNVTSMKSVIRSFGSAALVTATTALALAALTPAYANTGVATVGCMEGTITYSPTMLWPPNHKLNHVTISFVEGGDRDGSATQIKINSIKSSQGSFFTGVGNVGSAPEGTPAVTSVGLTAEREGNIQGGNVYTINVTCSENDVGGGGESQSVSLTVIVPHDMGP